MKAYNVNELNLYLAFQYHTSEGSVNEVRKLYRINTIQIKNQEQFESHKPS